MSILLGLEHKKVSVGASHDTDYKVMTTCAPDCPACAAKDQLRRAVEWLEGRNMAASPDELFLFEEDWQELRKAVGLPVP